MILGVALNRRRVRLCKILAALAYISVSPAQAQTIPLTTGTVLIEQGYSLSGRINLAGWKIALEATIGINRFYINAQMDEIDLKVLKIGATLDGEKHVQGKPKFVVDFSTSSALIDIEGSFEIPILETSGSVKVLLDKDGFQFKANMDLLFGTMVTDVTVKWDWQLKRFEARISPTKMFGGIVSICAATDMEACTQDAVGVFERDPEVGFEFNAGIKIPILRTEGKALVKVADGAFSMNLEASLFGVFKGSLSVLADRSQFEITFSQDVDMKATVDKIINNAHTAITGEFSNVLKIDETIKKVDDAIHWGANKICEVFGLEQIKVPATDYNLCDVVQKVGDGATSVLHEALKPGIEKLQKLLKDAADVVFEALGIIFKISGKTSFRVRISGHDSGLLQADALGFLSSTIDAANVAIEGCFGLDTTIFGVDVELKLDETCLPLDKDKVADIFVSIAGKVWEIVKDKIVMRAVDELKKLWGDLAHER